LCAQYAENFAGRVYLRLSMRNEDGGEREFSRSAIFAGLGPAGSPSMDMTDAIRYLGALALVLALVGAAGLALRRYGLPAMGIGGGRRLQIVESMMLGKGHRMLIVRCDGTEHVLVTAPQGASLLASAPAKPAPERQSV
jgi:flagellar protein FliO/FliZ